LAKKGEGEISKEGRDKLVDLLVGQFLHLTPVDGVTAVNIAEHEYFGYRNEAIIDKGKKALENGFEIEEGYVVYDESDYQLSNLVEKILEILDDEENYTVVDGDLSW